MKTFTAMLKSYSDQLRITPCLGAEIHGLNFRSEATTADCYVLPDVTENYQLLTGLESTL
jgi:hypothetical protein